MTPDGKEFYFSALQGSFDYAAILVTREVDGRWTEPEVCAFSADPSSKTIEPAISPDGRRFYFASNRGKPAGRERDFDLWVMEREGEAWSAPRPVGPPVNSDAAEFFPSVTRGGTLYFTRESPDGTSAIFRARPEEKGFAEPERLPGTVNAGADRFNAYVSPDESLLVVCYAGLPGGLGGVDYFALFRSPEDAWSAPVNLGPRVNTKGHEYSPYLSPDGRFFFFMSPRMVEDPLAGASRLTRDVLLSMHERPGTGSPGIWWVDAGFLKALAPAPRKEKTP